MLAQRDDWSTRNQASRAGQVSWAEQACVRGEWGAPAPPSFSSTVSRLLFCRPATLATDPRSQTGAVGKPRAHGSKTGRSQAPRSHPERHTAGQRV